MPTHSLEILARLQPPVPEVLAARADVWSPASVPVEPRPSASVVLLREGRDGLEVFLLHRHARMAFAPSMVVFPGGGLEPADRRAAGDPAHPVDPLRTCAVRETEEETGVRLSPGALVEWAHWTTPEVEPRRYDTRFFLAALPEGQTCRDVGTEADQRLWIRPQDALSRGLTILPPTRAVLQDLAGHPDVASALKAERTITPLLPRFELDGDRVRLVLDPAREPTE